MCGEKSSFHAFFAFLRRKNKIYKLPMICAGDLFKTVTGDFILTGVLTIYSIKAMRLASSASWLLAIELRGHGYAEGIHFG